MRILNPEKMKVQHWVFLILASTILISFGCNSDKITPGYRPTNEIKGRFIIGLVTGGARYSNLVDVNGFLTGKVNNSSSVDSIVVFNFSAQIFCDDNIGGRIVNWRFYIKKDSHVLLEIGEYNYYDSYFRLSVYSTSGSYSIPANSNMVLTVKHDDGASTPGFPFGQEIPNYVEFFVLIEDNYGSLHSKSVIVPFHFTPL